MSNTQEFRPGELVDITIRDARVTDAASDALSVLTREGVQIDGLQVSDESVTVERVAPPEWPPRPGDLWRDSRGTLWFATDRADYDKESAQQRIVMVSPSEYVHGESEDPQVLNSFAGPLTLVHREHPDEGGAR